MKNCSTVSYAYCLPTSFFPKTKSVEIDRLGVYYSDLIPVLIKAIQEQQEIIDKQSENITKQDSKINTLIAELNQLKNLDNRIKQIESIIKTANQ